MGLTTIGIIGAVTSAGATVYGAVQQQAAQQRAADYNAQLARNQALQQQYEAQQQAYLYEQQIQLAEQQYQADAYAAQQQAALLENQEAWTRYQQGQLEENAKIIEQEANRQADALTRQANENIERRDDDQSRRRAKIRADYAKTGLLLEGSPVAVLNEVYDRDQAELGDIFQTASNRRQETLFSGYQQAHDLRSQSTGLNNEINRLRHNRSQTLLNLDQSKRNTAYQVGELQSRIDYLMPASRLQSETLLSRAEFDRSQAHNKSAMFANIAGGVAGGISQGVSSYSQTTGQRKAYQSGFTRARTV